MKGRREYRDSLLDILNAIRDIDDFIKNIDFESFVKNKEKLYDVRRFECPDCKAKFNLYESPKSKFTIPKVKR